MKKYLLFSLVFSIFVIFQYGCGDNKTKEKLLGNTIVTGESSSSSTQTADSAAFAAKIASDFASNAVGTSDGQSAPSFRGSIGKMSPTIDESECATNGWIIFNDPSNGVTFRFRYLKSDGSPVTANNMLTIMANASTQAKRFQYRYTARVMGFNVTGDATMEFATVGSIQNGGVLSGTVTIVDQNGETFEATLTNITGDGTGKITSGSIYVELDSSVYGEWYVSLTFQSDGSATGTITGSNYTATIVINSDGTGTYTDSTGTHSI